jgi:hypothetical protein
MLAPTRPIPIIPILIACLPFLRLGAALSGCGRSSAWALCVQEPYRARRSTLPAMPLSLTDEGG